MADSLLPMILLIGMSTVVAGSLLAVGYLFGRPKHSGVDRSRHNLRMSR